MSKVDWIIHCVRNGAKCDECGTSEEHFLPFTCNAHTHGMENYNHQDFQMVLCLPDKEIARILNTFGLLVRDGNRFCAGDMVNGIYEDCPVRLDQYEETGRTVLRVIIPDKHNIFPEDPACLMPYPVQLLKTEDLCLKGGFGI